MNRIKLAVVAGMVLLISGCATSGPTADQRYDVQIQLYKEELKQKAEARQFYAQIASRCVTDACATQIALTAMAEGVAGAGGEGNSRPQYVPDRNYAAEFGIAAMGMIPVVGSTMVALRQSDNAREMNADQFAAWGGIIGDITAVVGDLQPNIEGGYIGGSVSGNGAGIGNSFAVSGNGNAIGDGNAQDNSSGQINGDWNNNSGRAMSPGPFTAGDCTGGPGTDTGGAGGTCSVTPTP